MQFHAWVAACCCQESGSPEGHSSTRQQYQWSRPMLSPQPELYWPCCQEATTASWSSNAQAKTAAILTDLPSLANLLLTKPKQSKIHLCSTLPVCGLKLEDGCAQERSALGSVRLHGLKIRTNHIFVLPIAAVLADEPRNWEESAVGRGHDSLDETPGSP